MVFIDKSLKMKLPTLVLQLKESTNKRSCAWTWLLAVIFLCAILLFVRSFVPINNNNKAFTLERFFSNKKTTESKFCQNQSKPLACESLPKEILSSTTNLEMQHLWKFPQPRKEKENNDPPKTLLAMAVGIKQKKIVNKIVEKFSSVDSTVMLFHYDGFVSGWSDFKWFDRALHISAANQTKWWFAKRFLHPDVVADYDYIFLWDEDLEVDYFNPKRYLSIVQREGLEISQPGLDLSKSEVHHRITVRARKGSFHRRIYAYSGGTKCDENSTGPPCTGWVEMMAPVFSKAAWRCAWHLIQNDLIHAWGLDYKLGYCAQGDRTKKVGIVDSEYIVHRGIPTLGVSGDVKPTARVPSGSPRSNNSNLPEAPVSPPNAERVNVRSRSYTELLTFKKRWQKAASEDICWKDPYA